MPTRPRNVVLTNSSVDVLNVIRNNASVNYQNYVPIATDDANSIKKIGAVIMDYPSLQNEFINALINRIAKVVVSSKLYTNPWNILKKGYLDFGETVEEVFVDLINVHQYDIETAENELFKRENPNVYSAFHILNYKTFYKVTIEQWELRKAFLSWEGVDNLIAKITEKIYTSANYDEFQVMKYMLATRILNGQVHSEYIDQATLENTRANVAKIKGISNKLTFMSPNYNLAGVRTHTPFEEQIIIINADFEAKMGVEVLATSFNMSKAEFIGREILVDSFGDLDNTRLAEIFEGNDQYEEISSSDLALLDDVQIVQTSRDFFQIYDNLNEFREAENGQGLYWNYFYHQWKILSVSPFENAVVYTTTTPAVTSVTVSGVPSTLQAGVTYTPTATVSTTGFAPESVTWSITAGSSFVEDFDSVTGKFTVKTTATTGNTITIKATSTYNTSKSGSATGSVA